MTAFLELRGSENRLYVKISDVYAVNIGIDNCVTIFPNDSRLPKHAFTNCNNIEDVVNALNWSTRLSTIDTNDRLEALKFIRENPPHHTSYGQQKNF